MPKSKVRAKRRKATKRKTKAHGGYGGYGALLPLVPVGEEVSEVWPCQGSIAHVTPIIACYCPSGRPSQAEKVAAAIVWETVALDLAAWVAACAAMLDQSLGEKLDSEVDDIVRTLFKGTAPLSSGWFVEACEAGWANVATFAKNNGAYYANPNFIPGPSRDSLLSVWDEEIWPRFVRTGVASSDDLGLLEHEPGRLVW